MLVGWPVRRLPLSQVSGCCGKVGPCTEKSPGLMEALSAFNTPHGGHAERTGACYISLLKSTDTSLREINRNLKTINEVRVLCTEVQIATWPLSIATLRRGVLFATSAGQVA